MGDIKIKNMEEFVVVSGILCLIVFKYFNDLFSVCVLICVKIEEVLEWYDYCLNMFVMNQNCKLIKNVGVVVLYLVDLFFVELVWNIEQWCIVVGYCFILYSLYGEQVFENDIFESLWLLKFVGVLMVLLGWVLDKVVIEKFCVDILMVLFDSSIFDVGVNFIGLDNLQFVVLMVEYFCCMGELLCFFEMVKLLNLNVNKWCQGYLDVMEWLGYEFMIIKVEGEGWDFEEIGCVGGLKVLSDKRFIINIVFCSNDCLVIGFFVVCYEVCLCVGCEVDCVYCVVGQDDYLFLCFICLLLMMVVQDYEVIFNGVVEVLLYMIEGEVGLYCVILFEGKLIM